MAETSTAVAGENQFESLVADAFTALPTLLTESHEFDQGEPGRWQLMPAMLATAAKERGLHVHRLASNMQIISDGRRSFGFVANMCQTLSLLDRLVTHDKDTAKRILRGYGLPVAHGCVVHNADEAGAALREIGGPVAIKPITGAGGKGITVDVRDEVGVADAVRDASRRGDRVVVEESIPSIDLRISVVAGQAIAATWRVPAHVTGDGHASISELAWRKNELRGANPYLKNSPLTLDATAAARLAERGLTPDSVPATGQRVFLHYKANISTGGDNLAVTEYVHPELLRLAERAAACFPTIHHCGVDILAQRFDVAPDEQRCVVCEVNCSNEIPMHEFPLHGTAIAATELELDGYFGGGAGSLPTMQAASVNAQVTRQRPMQRIGSRLRDLLRRDSMPGAATLTSQLAANRHTGEDPVTEPSPRRLDDRSLAVAVEKHGAARPHIDGGLVFATLGSERIVTERSGRTLFVMRLNKSRAALGEWLEYAGVAHCTRTTINADDLAAAHAFVGEHPGPWNVRAARDSGRRGGSYRLRKHDSVTRAVRRIGSRATQVIVEQASEVHTWRLLLLDSRVHASLALLPPTVTGNGAATINELVTQLSQQRRANPYLRHYPLPRGLPGNRRLAPLGLTGDSVLPAGQDVALNHATLVADGADTVGHAGTVQHAMAEQAQRVTTALGHPPVIAVTFAYRSAGTEPGWVVADIDTDPVLAQFAWPAAGHAASPYDAVAADIVRNRPRYVLTGGP